MAQYIDKSALVAEIEKRMERAKFEAQQAQENNDYVRCVGWSEHFATCGDILRIINTLEVKEVDLDFMLHEYWNLSSKITVDCLESATMTKDEMINFAKHFFELGIKAQKGEKV